jgi:SPP1 family predicted phage head-tail adaptor
MDILDIGQMDRRVTIRQYTESTNDMGEVVDTWTNLATVYAGLSYNTTTEKLESGKETVFGTVDFLIRYRSDIDEKMKVRFDGEDYDIKSIIRHDKRGRDRYLIIKAVKDE